MIVCHCNVICHRQIEGSCAQIRGADPSARLSPHVVYRALGKKLRCGRCVSQAAKLIDAHCESALDGCSGCPMAHTLVQPTIVDGAIAPTSLADPR